MIPEKMIEVLQYEGVVAIASQGGDGPHLINTWNSYVRVTEEGNLLIPAGRMNTTEDNLKKDNRLLLTLGSREVDGFNSKGTGFLVVGTGEFIYEGSEYDIMKEKFPWMRGALKVKPEEITQTL